MSQKNKKGIISTILDLALIVPRTFSFMGNIKSLINIEARIAAKSLAIILMLILITASLLTTSWICVLALLFTWFQALKWTVASSIAVILLLNIIVLLVVTLFIAKHKKNLFFPETREHLSEHNLF
jgi:membrane protein YdbS with pleckstrin-like domain